MSSAIEPESYSCRKDTTIKGCPRVRGAGEPPIHDMGGVRAMRPVQITVTAATAAAPGRIVGRQPEEELLE